MQPTTKYTTLCSAAPFSSTTTDSRFFCCVKCGNMMLRLILCTLQPDRPYTVPCKLAIGDGTHCMMFLYMHLWQGLTPRVMFLWLHYMLPPLLLILSVLCSIYFNMYKSLETLVHHRAKLQGRLAVSCECTAHSEILNRLFNLKLSSSEPSGGSSQVHF